MQPSSTAKSDAYKSVRIFERLTLFGQAFGKLRNIFKRRYQSSSLFVRSVREIRLQFHTCKFIAAQPHS